MAEGLLAESVAAAVATHPTLWLLSIGAPEGEAWLPASSLGDEERLRAALASVREDTGVERPDVLAQWMAEWLGWIVGHPAIALLAAQRRAPVLGADAAVLIIPQGRPGGLRVGRGRVHVLPGDARAEDPDAVIVGSERALAGAVVEQTAAVLAPAIATLARIGRRSRAALWRGASDRLARAFADEAAAAGDDAVLELARGALGAPGPLRAPPHFREVAPHGLMHVRRGCCLLHVLGDEPCLSCPLVDDAARSARAV